MNYEEIFNTLYPNFFEEERIYSLPKENIFNELVLDLKNDLGKLDEIKNEIPSNITFGKYHGNISAIKEAISLVDENWVKYFNDLDNIVCAFDDEKIVSCCTLTDWGYYKDLRVGGPGSVSTIPDYRRQGIGMELVKHATRELHNMGYDLSWIHHTHLGKWYSKLGYDLVLQWNGKGFI